MGEVIKENPPNNMKLINYLGSPGPNMKRNPSKARPRPASGGVQRVLIHFGFSAPRRPFRWGRGVRRGFINHSQGLVATSN